LLRCGGLAGRLGGGHGVSFRFPVVEICGFPPLRQEKVARMGHGSFVEWTEITG
jgi:hypothetical protein